MKNGFAEEEIEEYVHRRIYTFLEQATAHDITTYGIRLYYENHISSAYKEDEEALKKIIEDIKPTQENPQLKLLYLKKKLASIIIMKNSCRPTNSYP